MKTELLRDYQIEPAKSLARSLFKHGVGIDASDMGIGKTYISSAIVEHCNAATLVVCPKILRSTWHEVAGYFGTEVDTMNWEMVRTGRTPYGKWVRGRRGMRWEWNENIELLIFDEAHVSNGLETKNAALVYYAKRQGIPFLWLSATPAERLTELRALGYALGLHNGGDFREWLGGLGYGFVDGKIKFRFSRKEELDLMDQFNKYVFPEYGIRLKADDIPGFPETQLEIRGVDADSGDCSEVNRLMQEAIQEFHEYADENYAKNRWEAERARVAQACELAKVPALVSIAKDAVAQGRSVPIFVNYRRTVDLLMKALPKEFNAQMVTGVSTEHERSEREHAIKLFQSDAARVIVCISDAGGVGIGLHDVTGKYPRTTIICPGDKAKIFRQVIGRVRRNGAKSKSHQIIVTLRGVTVDEARRHNLRRKLEGLDAMADGLESLTDDDLDLWSYAEKAA